MIESVKEGDIPGLDSAAINKNGIANILSLKRVADKYPVTFDSRVERAFCVHTPDGIVKIKETSEGLYALEYLKPENKFTGVPATARTVVEEVPPQQAGPRAALVPVGTKPQEQAAFMEMVAENKSNHTKAECQRAKRARDLLWALGFPSIVDLKKIVHVNSIMDCPVTTQDVDLAEKIYGPDVASIKGKTTHKKPPPARSDIVAIPPELHAAQRDVDLCFDAMFVNQIPFLTSVSKQTPFRRADPLPSQSTKVHVQCLESLFALCEQSEHPIRSLHFDREFPRRNMVS